MPRWVVSAHGGAVKSTSGFRQFIAPTEKFKYGVTYVRSGLELVMFTPQSQIFYGGDPELDALIAGNENDAVITTRIHKIKEPYKIVPDYVAYGTNDFRSGIYIVGSGGAGGKAIDLPNGTTMKLSDIMNRAQGSGVDRIYWLACTCFP